MKIVHAEVFSEDGIFEQREIAMKNGLFVSAEDVKGEEILDASGLYAVPGLIDIHFHGCVGYDFCDGTVEAFDAILNYEASQGVTAVCPATMTLDERTLERVFSLAGVYRNSQGAALAGITMEGPFVSASKKGAQNEAYIRRPDTGMYRKMQKLSSGKILQVAVAPEEDHEFRFAKELNQEVVISVAHTCCDYETARQAFQNGYSHVTHLYNAMNGFGHREPGVVGAACDAENIYVELICDGIHIHPSAVRTTFKMFGKDRICMISDSMMAAGMPDGTYALGGQEVFMKGRKATLSDGTIAGSASSLMECLRTAVKEMGIPLETALKACTVNPAKSLHIEKMHGSIREGKYADLVLLDHDLNVVKVFLRGKEYTG